MIGREEHHHDVPLFYLAYKIPELVADAAGLHKDRVERSIFDDFFVRNLSDSPVRERRNEDNELRIADQLYLEVAGRIRVDSHGLC